MKTNPTHRRGFTLVELLVVIVIIASLAGLTAPMVIRQRKKADQTEATSNARQIGLAMFEFESEYGSFPDGDTQTDVEDNNPDSDVTADTTSSNGYFRQLFVSNITQSEQMFYAKTGLTKKPDGVIQGEDSLEAREVGFGYILNVADGLSTAGNPSRVTVVTPLAEGGAEFNPDPFDSKAVVLRIDNSVASLNVNDDGEALLGGGKSLLDSGNDTIWGSSITPTIIAPEE